MNSLQSLKSVCLRRTKVLLGLKIPQKDEVNTLRAPLAIDSRVTRLGQFLCEVSLNDDAQEGEFLMYLFCGSITFIFQSTKPCSRALLKSSSNFWHPKPHR